jgi:hypothetical protein
MFSDRDTVFKQAKLSPRSSVGEIRESPRSERSVGRERARFGTNVLARLSQAARPRELGGIVKWSCAKPGKIHPGTLGQRPHMTRQALKLERMLQNSDLIGFIPLSDEYAFDQCA